MVPHPHGDEILTGLVNNLELVLGHRLFCWEECGRPATVVAICLRDQFLMGISEIFESLTECNEL